jgi:hypothetical protein
MDVIKKLKIVAERTKEVPLARRRAVLHEELAKVILPKSFSLPLDPTYVQSRPSPSRASRLCRYDSNQTCAP